MVRKRSTIGRTFVSDGVLTDIKTEKFCIDNKRKFYCFDIFPLAKIRMTIRDKFWKASLKSSDSKKRNRAEAVKRYYDFKDLLKLQATEMSFEIDETFESVFLIPMPDSWSKKKKERMNGMPHKSKPDTDNLVKCFLDCLEISDQHIWKINCEKRWAFAGSIIVYK